jgi:hypothetical protein
MMLSDMYSSALFATVSSLISAHLRGNATHET